MAACPTTEVVRLAADAMATRFEVVLAGCDPAFLRAAGEAALAEIHACEAAISPFRAGSAIARVNREAAERPVRVDPLTMELLLDCAALWRATAGAFDPTVGPLLGALGLRGAPRDESKVAGARAATGMDGVELDADARTVRFTRPGMALDVGAVGKGHALDLAAEALRELGVDRALLHGGTSTAVAIGAPPDRDGWRVALGRQPGAPAAVLRDEALSVSAAHGRRNSHGEGHVVDPRSGRPVAAGEVCAVAAPAARAADAWSTALLVLPADHPVAAPLRIWRIPSPPEPTGRP